MASSRYQNRGRRSAAFGSFAPKPVGEFRRVPFSSQQTAILDELRNTGRHIQVRALAGTGKTTTAVQSIVDLLIDDPRLEVCVMAFNRHIADELIERFRAARVQVYASTYHSVCLKVIKQAYPKVEVLGNRGHVILDGILDEPVPDPFAVDPEEPREKRKTLRDHLGRDREYSFVSAANRLVSLCKSLLIPQPSAVELEEIASRYGVDINNSIDLFAWVVPEAILRSLTDKSTCDFDDMLFWVVVDRMTVPHYDLIVVDEYQDTNRVQQELVFQLAGPRGRIMVIGDPNQAIYGFRGADTRAMPRMLEALTGTERGVVELPLTMTRRCPSKHVDLARNIVEEFEATDEAPDGILEEYAEDQALDDMAPGDLVLCRTNGPLVTPCWELIVREKKATIRGRDIGQGIVGLIRKLGGYTVSDLLERLDDYQEIESGKIIGKLGKEKGGSRIAAIDDRCHCLRALARGCRHVTDLEAKINRVFADFEDDGRPKDAVVFSTVHKAKGLEADTVWILRPDLMPHPMAKQDWEATQEMNLLYVAATRSKSRLVFVGEIPTILGGKGESFGAKIERLQREREARS